MGPARLPSDPVPVPGRLPKVIFISRASAFVSALTTSLFMCVCVLSVRSMRKLPSIKNRDQYVEYVAEIVDSGQGYPLFKVTASDDPEHPFVQKTSSSTCCVRMSASFYRLDVVCLFVCFVAVALTLAFFSTAQRCGRRCSRRSRGARLCLCPGPRYACVARLSHSLCQRCVAAVDVRHE